MSWVFLLWALAAQFGASSAFAQNVWGDSAYGAYGLFPQGSDRVMALGGAAVAISDGAEALLFNPAGPALANWRVDVGSTDNRIDHQELAYNFPDTYGVYETKYDSPYSYFFYAGAVRIGSWVIGLGYSSPYFYEYFYINPLSNLEITRFEVKVRSFDYMLARRFGEHFAIGVAGHTETLREFYNNRSLPAPIPEGFEAKGSGQYFSGGFMLKNDRIGLGVSHSQARKMKVDTSANTLLATYNTTPFRDVVIPARTSVGIFYKPIRRLMITADADFIEKTESLVYVSAATTSTEFLKSDGFALYHGGVEVTTIESRYLDLILRAGGYNEPTRFTEGSSRNHVTYGFELRLGPAVVSYAADNAQSFKNSAIGFSLNIESF